MGINWCDPKSKNQDNLQLFKEIDSSRMDRKSCYFHIRYVEGNSSGPMWQKQFNLKKAREFCQGYENSTLVTIRDDQEAKFIKNYAIEMKKMGEPYPDVILGLKKVRGKNIVEAWDDNIKSTYDPLWYFADIDEKDKNFESSWTVFNLFEEAFYTRSNLMRWNSVIRIFCKQNLVQ